MSATTAQEINLTSKTDLNNTGKISPLETPSSSHTVGTTTPIDKNPNPSTTNNEAPNGTKKEAEEAVERIEAAKRRAAIRAVDDYFQPSMNYIGIGSGTTIQYVVEAIKERLPNDRIHSILFIPTGYQSRMEIEKRGLIAMAFDSLPEGVMLDVAFDGADEVDEELNCVKGGGACLFQEKLVAMKARKFVCVADYRKDVPHLLTDWTYIPIEVAPLAVKPVIRALRALGSPNPTLRSLQMVKSGPLKTDQDFYIVKAPFPPLLMRKDAAPGVGTGQTWGVTKEGLKGRVWDAGKLATAIKAITGVLEVGLFVGANGTQAEELNSKEGGPVMYDEELPQGVDDSVAGPMGGGGMMASQGGQKPVAAYFGLQDGSVRVRKAASEK